METIRQGLNDTVNELNELLLKTNDPTEEGKIRQLRRAYFDLKEAELQQLLDRNTAAYTEALERLGQACRTIEDAKQDIAKVTKAIELATTAAKGAAKVLNVALDLL
jgi:hypothetical protein